MTTVILPSPELLAVWQRARATLAQRLNLVVISELAYLCHNWLCRAMNQWQAHPALSWWAVKILPVHFCRSVV